MEIEGKRVLITGAGRGLGRALVTALLDAGVGEVIAGTRNPEAREALQGPRVTAVQLDVRRDADVEAVSRMGTFDILINNAGVAGWGWEDNAYGGSGPVLRFAETGPQTIRIQGREDGISIDQIVLSPVRYLTARPGLAKNDATLLSEQTGLTTGPPPAS